ncbi:MAG: hypothetical protein II375_02775 [Bacteroidales bacterium]|nr:hypothetical protein [Bacteroidales bacterium]
MRQYITKLLAVLLLLVPAKLSAQNDTVIFNHYDARVARYQQRYAAMIPKYVKLQFAGSIGMFSAGLGWDYGKNRRWETDVLIGFVPRLESNRAKLTFTARECFVPWDFPIGSSWVSFSPLRATAGINAIIGHEFWTSNPERYPEGYYFFSTKFHFIAGFGQQLNLNISYDRRRPWKSVSVYYNLTTNDKYVLSGFSNKEVGFFDVFHLDIGMKLQIL